MSSYPRQLILWLNRDYTNYSCIGIKKKILLGASSKLIPSNDAESHPGENLI